MHIVTYQGLHVGGGGGVCDLLTVYYLCPFILGGVTVSIA